MRRTVSAQNYWYALKMVVNKFGDAGSFVAFYYYDQKLLQHLLTTYYSAFKTYITSFEVIRLWNNQKK